jgi:CRP/FNR family transcriptional regulator
MLGQVSKPGADVWQQTVPAKERRHSARHDKSRRELLDWLGPAGTLLLDRCDTERTLACGDYLVHGTDAGAEFCILLRGVMDLYGESPHGILKVQDFRYPGDLIAPARPNVSWGVNVKALTVAQLLIFPFSDVRSWCKEEPELGCCLFECFCGDFARRAECLRHQWCLPAQGRLATFLLEVSDRIGKRSGRSMSVCLPMAHNEIAKHLNIRTETLCRILSRWKAEGLIEMETPRHVQVPNAALLEAKTLPERRPRRKNL